MARSTYVPRITYSDVISEYLSKPNTSASMSVTMVTVSDSLTSRVFAEDRIGRNLFMPVVNRSLTFVGIVAIVISPLGLLPTLVLIFWAERFKSHSHQYFDYK